MTGRRMRDVVALIGWAAFLAAALATLHAAGRGALTPPPLSGAGLRSWAAARQPAEAAAALLRLGAMGLGWYLLCITVLGTIVRLVRLAPLVAAVDALTIPGVRSVVAAALGASLSVTVAAQPASAAARIPVMHRLPKAPAPPPTTITTTTTVAGPAPDAPPDDALAPPADPEAPVSTPPTPAEPDTVPGPDETATAPESSPASPPAPNPPGGTPATWTVAPGDNLWRIAASVLERSSGQTPSPAAVVPYWRSLIEANRSRLHDPADPGLIFAGQVLALPDPPAA